MKLTLKIWRQKNAKTKGSFVDYKMDNVSPEMSFLEMLDALNKKLVERIRIPLLSITTAGKVSAGHAECT